MATVNARKGSATVELNDGKKHKLVYDYNVLADIEEETGIPAEELGVAMEQKKLSLVRLLVWGGLLHEQPDLTVRQAGALIPLGKKMGPVINATMAVPAINASFGGDHIVRFGSVGLSVAIAIEDGLVTPVVKNAETKSLLQISREVKDFAVRAKDRKLRPDEFDGGTITISNLGAWGIESFDAIVNPPQAAILSVGAVIEKPVVQNGQIVVGQRINLGLSCDHRVVDGAIAAAFLSEVKKLIESPALMLV
jgi:pyruvate/2-oxoglutarate dehydrogenase complex dihydrolipoamide acyltransferase (E2) component